MVFHNDMARYYVESAVVLAVILFIPGAFSQTFAITAQDTGHWIFKQGATTGTEVGALTIIRTGNGSQTFDGTSVVIRGSCLPCLGSITLEGTSTFNRSAKIFPRGNETWDACKGNLTEVSAEGAAPGLPYCIAEFRLVSSNMTELGSNLSRNVYINRTPSMTVVPMLSSIPQNAPLDTLVFQVTTNDQDNLPRTISIDSCTPATSCPFSLRSSGGPSCTNSSSCTFTRSGEAYYNIVLGQTLVNSTAASLSIRLKLVDGISLNNPDQQHTLIDAEQRTIAVLPPRPPVFTERPGLTEVNENDPVNTTIVIVKAIDDDNPGLPSEIAYTVCELATIDATSCSSTPAQTRIEKIPETGQGKVLLNTVDQLSSLVGNFFLIRITATKVNTPWLSMNLPPLRIFVNDVNNNSPVFQILSSVGEDPGQEITKFNASIRENAVVGTAVEFADQFVIRVSDMHDLGVNARFRLSVIGPNENTFEAYPTDEIQGVAFLTVRVKNNTALDAETVKGGIMEVKIRATSTEPAVGSGVGPFWIPELVLRVTIVDMNDNPTFYTPMVDDGSHVRDNDVDPINRNDVQFYLKDQTQVRQFAVSAQGKLEVIGALDYETVQLHRLSIG
ncbi:hypothetical protein BV898_13587 [Hypsibius exemplaris]|uniref:Cadherin domain-containing protein n=1 Tax=Hypsibius exemplaris TaxID=2072580 RepID=A0A1W0WAA0_HYPEX|nr:hypothetical protein BV898_13587 [Hypsibius exemplaris]